MLTIDDLPDDVLLETFDSYVARYQYMDFRQYSDHEIKMEIELWKSLVHVCRRWRYLVFASPRRLNLRLYYDPEKSARKSLDVWPAFPLLIQGTVSETSEDDVIALLKHSDRICQIDLECDSSWFYIEKILTAMQVPFPELTVLRLSSSLLYTFLLFLPDSFLGGSAPRLRSLDLTFAPFRGLPKLLLSATHLVNLYLIKSIHNTGYISPEAMTTSLSMLTSLETLRLEFKVEQSYPGLESRRPFPSTRSILPTLTNFSFKGVSTYLEEFVARIDAPQLYHLSTMLFHVVDSLTQLGQFISRTPTLGAYNEAYLIFGFSGALVRLCPFQPELSDDRMVKVQTFLQASDLQLSTLVQICTLRPLLTIENLYVDRYLGPPPLGWMDGIENTNLKWISILLPFTAVKNLYLCKKYSPRIALALHELTGERTTEVLPVLENVFLEEFQPSEPVEEGLEQFISARRLANHPVVISIWHRDFIWDYDGIIVSIGSDSESEHRS